LVELMAVSWGGWKVGQLVFRSVVLLAAVLAAPLGACSGVMKVAPSADCSADLLVLLLAATSAAEMAALSGMKLDQLPAGPKASRMVASMDAQKVFLLAALMVSWLVYMSAVMLVS
jgi:hypothetical protein